MISGEKNWTSFEIMDADGEPKCFLIKTPKQENGSLDTDKLLQVRSGFKSSNDRAFSNTISIRIIQIFIKLKNIQFLIVDLTLCIKIEQAHFSRCVHVWR